MHTSAFKVGQTVVVVGLSKRSQCTGFHIWWFQSGSSTLTIFSGKSYMGNITL